MSFTLRHDGTGPNGTRVVRLAHFVEVDADTMKVTLYLTHTPVGKEEKTVVTVFKNTKPKIRTFYKTLIERGYKSNERPN